MKNINETFQRMNPASITALAEVLNCAQNEKSIITAMQTIPGIRSVLSKLNNVELQILEVVYSGNNGITLLDLEKKVPASVEVLDSSSFNLFQNLLLYTIKNRQLLTNKLDKLYAIKELEPFLVFERHSRIASDFKSLEEELKQSSATSTPSETVTKDKKLMSLLLYMASNGGIVSIEEAYELIGANADSTLFKGVECKVLKHIHCLDCEFKTYIILEHKYMGYCIKKNFPKAQNASFVHNRFRFVINILRAYDSISSNGLFLTKQLNFRKIDLKRIEDSFMPILKMNGEPIDNEELALFAIHVLSRLGCLRLHKDAASASLKNIVEELNNPHQLILNIFKVIHSLEHKPDYFPSPYEIPKLEMFERVIKIIHANKDMNINYLKIVLLAGLLSEKCFEQDINLQETRKLYFKKIDMVLTFLYLFGIIEEDNEAISFSDIAYKTIHKISNIPYEEKPEPAYKKCVYINPDFTLMIPAEELSSESVYFLLTHTEVNNDDVVLNCTINRSSLVQAYKRGIELSRFMGTLEKYSKNEIPQNLNFLINDWLKQTVKIVIKDTLLLHSSHPSFIQDMLVGRKKKAVIEHISPHYAIIDKNHLDDIIKTAKANDALISLFEDQEPED